MAMQIAAVRIGSLWSISVNLFYGRIILVCLEAKIRTWITNVNTFFQGNWDTTTLVNYLSSIRVCCTLLLVKTQKNVNFNHCTSFILLYFSSWSKSKENRIRTKLVVFFCLIADKSTIWNQFWALYRVVTQPTHGH